MVISEQGLTLTVTTPNGGEVLTPGQQVNIQWQSSGAISHTVKLSTDGGNTFTDISPQLSGLTQSFLWTVPNLSTTQARIRIAARDILDNRVTDDSNSNFSIQAAPQQQLSVRVLAPNGNETFQPGQQVNIQWQSTGAQSHVVKLSTDGGNTFPTDISPQLSGSAQSFLWTVPNQATTRARIRVAVRDAADNRQTDDGDADFIIQATPPPTLSVRVLTPNGGEVLQPGQQVNITWQSSGAVSQSVKLSTDGVNFVDISAPLSGSTQSFLWTVPNQPTTQARIRLAVRDAADNRVTDDSDAPFVIQAATPPLTLQVSAPNGNETFQPGQQVNITWQSTGAVSHEVKLSRDGGATFTDISPQLSGSAQSFLWTVPNQPTTQGRIRVAARDAASNRVTDDSNTNFTIAPPQPLASVQVLSPNGGESFQQGQQVNILWQSAGAVSHEVKFSRDGGATFTDISPSLPGTTQNFLWTVPTQPTTQGVIRVAARDVNGARTTDDSNAFFNIQATVPPPTVRVLAPNGGESLRTGTQFLIRWESTGAISHSVKFSADGGANFVDLSPELPATAQSFTWTVPNQPTTQARIRVAARNSAGTRVTDDSDVNFTIELPPPQVTVKVLAPNGSETFQPGQQVNIQWQSSGAVSHSVKLSTDGGANFTDISSELPGTAQSFLWTVPNQQTDTARIRVAVRDAADNRKTDDSDGNFKIQAPPPPPTQLTVEVLSPNGDESFQPGQQVNIQWQSAGAISHSVKLSTDGGNSFPTDISPQLSGTAQSFLWTVPNLTTAMARIRVAVRDAADNRQTDDSDKNFKIGPPPPPPPPPTPLTVTVLAPDGDETFQPGQRVTIRWQSTGAVSHSIKLSTDGGSTFPTDIAAELGGNVQSFDWTVPDRPTDKARIRVAVRDAANTRKTDDSNANFTIETPPAPVPIKVDVLKPGASEALKAGQQYTITWQTSGSGVAKHVVRYASDGKNFETIPNGVLPGSARSAIWTVPADLTTAAVIRVSARDSSDKELARDDSAAFSIFPAPMLRNVSPDNGATQEAGKPAVRQVVQINGLNFRKGSTPADLPKVKFGQVFSEEVTFVDNMTLKALVPPRTTAGSVTVTVINPDGQSDRIEKGFTYLSAKQAARARVESVSTLTLLENVRNVGVTLLGRNLKKAYEEGVLCLRGPEGVNVRYENVAVSSDDKSQQDKIVFDVFVTVSGGLNPLDRIILNVLASVRPNAHKDLLVESSRQMLTVVSSKSPVPLGFTSRVQRGTASPFVVAGRSLKNCRLKSNLPQLTFSPSTSDEKFVIALLQVGPNAPDQVSVTVTDEKNNTVGTYQVNVVDAPVPAPTTSGGYDPVDPNTQLAPVPNQTLPESMRELKRAHPLNPNAPKPVGVPNTQSSFLTSALTLSNFTFNIPVLDEVRVLPFFDRSGGTVLVDLPISVKLGRLFGIRGLPLVLVFRLEIEISISVALVVSVNPFTDVNFGGQSFNEFLDYNPVSDFPGLIVIGFEVRVDITIRVLFLLAIITPDNRFIKVAAFLLELGISSDGKQLELAPGVQLRATVKQVLPMAGVAGRVDLLGSATPIKDPFGTRGYYFARATGRVCLPWLFDLTVARFIGGVRETTPLQTSFAAEICLTINDNKNMEWIYVQPDPVTLEVGQSMKAVAFKKDKNDGIPAGGDPLTAPGEVKFFARTPNVPAMVSTDGTVKGIQLGAGKFFPQLTTSGQAFGLFPESVLGFTTPTATSPPEAILRDVDVFVVKSDEVVVDLIAGPITRAEPFEPTATPSLPLSIKAAGSLLKSKFKVKIEAKKPVMIPNPLKLRVQGTQPKDVPFDQFFELKLIDDKLKIELNAESKEPKVVEGLVVTARHREMDGDKVPEDKKRKVPPGEVLIKPPGSEYFDFTRIFVPDGPAPKPESTPPGPCFFMMEVTVTSEDKNVRLRKSSGGGAASDRLTFMLKFEVDEPETYEEYYRVRTVPLASVNIKEFVDFQVKFAAELKGFTKGETEFKTLLDTWGDKLWTLAFTAVQTNKKGDRPLYLTRLQAAVSIRKFCTSGAGKSFCLLPSGEPDLKKITDLTAVFEEASRGFRQVKFEGAAATEKKVLLLGFDPFFLSAAQDQGNITGLLALTLNNAALTGSGVKARFESVVLPVRFADFDTGFIERLLRSVVNKVDMVITCSIGRGGRYDIERFACRRRWQWGDNNNISFPYAANGDAPLPANLTDGPEYIETTLPYQKVFTGPNDKKQGASGPIPLVFNQSYKFRNVSKKTGNVAERPETEPGKDDAFKPTPPVPSTDPRDTSLSGSAGAFLSNEVFYRVTAFFAGKKVPCGHLHTTGVDTENLATGAAFNVIEGCKDILMGLISGLK